MTPDPRLRPLVVSVDPDPDRAASDPGLAEAVADGRPVLASWVVAGSDDAARVVVLFGAATREQPNPDAPKPNPGENGWPASLFAPPAVSLGPVWPAYIAGLLVAACFLAFVLTR